MTKINDNTHGEIINNLFTNNSGSKMRVAVRIVREAEGHRVDINTGWGPWEAIDGGTPLASLTAAKRFVRGYKARAKAQQTYQPR